MRYLILFLPLLLFANSPQEDSSSILSKIKAYDTKYLDDISGSVKQNNIKDKLFSYADKKGKIKNFSLLKQKQFVDNRIQEYLYLVEYDHGHVIMTFRYVKVSLRHMKLTEMHVSKFSEEKHESQKNN